MLQVRNVGAGSLRAWSKRPRHGLRIPECSSAAWTSTLVSKTSNYSSSITRYNSSRFEESTKCPPLFHEGSGGRFSACSSVVAGSASTSRSPASTKADIVVPRRGASSRRRCITESSMLRVVFIWITIPSEKSGPNGRGSILSAHPRSSGLGHPGSESSIQLLRKNVIPNRPNTTIGCFLCGGLATPRPCRGYVNGLVHRQNVRLPFLDQPARQVFVDNTGQQSLIGHPFFPGP